MTKRGLVLAGGELTVNDRLRAFAAEADVVVAADAGLRHAAALGVSPDVIAGDFDSVEGATLRQYSDVPQQRHPAAKGKLDLEIALDLALARGVDEIDVMGALGSRLDQTLAGLLVCARLQREGVPCRLLATERDAFPLAAGDAIPIGAPRGTTFSVVSLDENVVVSIAGSQYDVDQIRLPFGVGLGVSNVVDGDASVTCHEGLLVVIVERTADDR